MAMLKSMRLWIRSRRPSIPVDRRPYPDRPAGRPTCDQLRHVVILTMSDHSYDNYFGMLLTDRGEAGFRLGPSHYSVNARDDTRINVFHVSSTAQQDAKLNSWNASHLQFEDKDKGFVASAEEYAPTSPRDWVMGYWTEEDLPFWYQLARTFPIADRWFSSCLGPELPNRRFLVAGTANGVITEGLHKIDKPTNRTIFDLLSRYNISWAIFNTRVKDPSQRLSIGYQIKALYKAVFGSVGTNILRTAVVRLLPFVSLRWDDGVRSMADVYPMSTLARERYVQSTESFMRRAEDGTLPAVSFVDPDYSLFSGEQPQDVRSAESFVAQVVNAVMHGSGWEYTILVVLHDSHGGYYDHVPPPEAVPPGDAISRRRRKRRDEAASFDQLGFRVPVVLVSPYARPSYVLSNTCDHTSILKLIEELWNLPPLTLRDASAYSPLEALDLAGAPRFLTPPKFSVPPDRIKDYRQFKIDPFRTDSFKELMVRIAQVSAYGLIGYLAFLTANPIVEAVAVYAVLLVAARLVIQTGFWRHWAFWQPSPREERRIAVYGTVLALVVLTIFVTLLLSELYERGVVRLDPAPHGQVPWHFLEAYVWNLVDSIPGLGITETFNWKPPFTFVDGWSRSILIIYRLLVLAPVIDLLVQIIRPPTRSD
jgi:phospholipase C